MADVAILASQVQATPNGYTIPGGQEIILKSIRVSFDGSGAGGSFVPVLQLVAPGQSGTVVSEYPLGSTLAAGASADVTWFPGVNTGGGSGGGASTVTDTVEVFTGFGQDTSGDPPNTWTPFSGPSGPTVTIPVTGTYLVRFAGWIRFYTDRTYEYQLGLSVNAVAPSSVRLPFIMDYPGSYAPSGANGTTQMFNALETTIAFTAGDILAIWTWRDAGGAAWVIRTLTATLIG